MATGTWTVLVLGGVGSGKSLAAELIAASWPGQIVYAATGPADDGTDPQWSARVAAHQARRPDHWATLEIPPGGDLPGVLAAHPGGVLIDSLPAWIAGFQGAPAPIDELCANLATRAQGSIPTMIVSDEVSVGAHPLTEADRQFADALGTANQQIAAANCSVLLVVAGRVMPLPAPFAAPSPAAAVAPVQMPQRMWDAQPPPGRGNLV